MPQFKTKAIVLHRINLTESSLIVTFFTRDFGKVKCVVKGARKIKSRFGGRFEPFSCLNIIYLGKEHQNLYLLTHCDTIKVFYNLREDYERLTTGCYFTEMINLFTREAEKNRELFNLFYQALDALQVSNSLSVLTRIFEMKTVALCGYAPKFNSCMVCNNKFIDKYLSFDFQQGGIICGKCLNGNSPGRRISLGTLNYLKKIMTIKFETVDRLKIPKGLDKEIALISQIYLKTVLGRDIKSYKLLE